MKSKLNYLISVSLKRKTNTKWFVLANILMAIVLVGLINIDQIITAFGGDFSDSKTMYVIDNTDKSYDLFNENLNTALLTLNLDNNYEVALVDITVDEAKELLKNTEDDIEIDMVVVINNSEDNIIEAQIISNNTLDLVVNQAINMSLSATKSTIALSETSISQEELDKLYSAILIENIYLDEEANEEEATNELIGSVVIQLIVIPFFMLTLFLVQMIGAEVNDEKTTRGMEIIISNVSPKTHFFAKIVAANLFVLIQGALLVAYGLLGLLVRFITTSGSLLGGAEQDIMGMVTSAVNTEVGQMLVTAIPLTLILMILTLISYSLLSGILASMTTNIEDFQQLQTPIILISLAGYYLAMFASLFEGALFIKVVSFIPLISAILAPSLLMLGQLSIFEFIISIVLVIITNYLLIVYGLRVYKVGILNYSSKDLWKKMFKALKNK